MGFLQKVIQKAPENPSMLSFRATARNLSIPKTRELYLKEYLPCQALKIKYQ
jgi:hypothetical protein